MQWTEITQDNMDEVYDIPIDLLVIAFKIDTLTICRMYNDMSPTISTMAKMGGYYYIELPKLKINDNENYGE